MTSSRGASTRPAVALVLLVVGLTSVLQGLGVPIGRSFMIGDLRWTAIGIGLVAVAAALLWRQLGRR